jgi:signal transduction histidine kinase
LINVMENAIKHGRDAGRIFVSASQLNDRYAEIRVDDDGPGVPSGERRGLHARTARGQRAFGGNGLGLALVRLMIERIGGEVDVVRSSLGGARFHLRVPLAPV